MNTSITKATIQYIEDGMAIFPLVPRGKTPLTPHGFKDASKDPTAINKWWNQWPSANIGIATGFASGFWVLDIDGEEGEASLRALEAKNGTLPQSVEVITGGGGRHIYFALPNTGLIPNSASKLGRGLDVRGDGGYVVAPPSIHPNGQAYEWSVDSVAYVAPAPTWLLGLIQSLEPIRTSNSQVDWVSMLQGVAEGRRNDCLTRLVGKLLGHRLDAEFAFYLGWAWNEARCTPPLPQDEFLRTFISIAQREAKKRRVV